MARAAVKAKQQARAKAQQPARHQRGRRRHAGGGDPNQQLFFARLRRRQKWVFLALAIVFAATFVGVGVGSGSGAGLDQLFNGILGGGGTSVSKAQDEIKTNPTQGYQDLASAYLQKNPPDTTDAVGALQSYLKLKKNDVKVWLELASLEQGQGDNYVTLYQQQQQQAALEDPSQAIAPTGALGQQLPTNPVGQYYSQQSSSVTSQLASAATSAYSTALQAYQTVAKLQPHNANAQFQIAQLARLTSQSALELKSLQRYVALYPQSPQLTQVEGLCKQLGGICTPQYVKSLKKSKK